MSASALRRFAFRAMGTHIQIVVPADAAGAGAAARGVIERWERTLSRFRPDSELCAVNRGAGTRVAAGALLCAATTSALRAAAATGGAFDPTLGRRMEFIGYDRPMGRPGPARPRARFARHVAGAWRAVDVDDERGTITLPPGVALDLGGIAKGMAADAVAADLEARGVRTGLVDAGGDLRTIGAPREWRVGLDEVDGEVVTLTSGAIATSTRSRRAWRHHGRAQHHILDPVTGLPARAGLRAVTVAAGDCAQAEAAATAAFVLGRERGRALLERIGLPALLVSEDGGIERVATWPGRAAA